MTWSKHSRRIVPITRSAYARCHGDSRRKHFPDAHFLDLSGEIVAKDAIPIAQQIAWRRVPWERVAELLGGPFRSGMSRNTEMEDPTSSFDR